MHWCSTEDRGSHPASQTPPPGRLLEDSESNPESGEFDGGEIVVGSPVITRCDAAHLFEFVEEAFDQIALSIDPTAEGEGLLFVCLGGNVRPYMTCSDKGSYAVDVIGFVSQNGRARRCLLQKPLCHRGIAGLSGGELQSYGPAFRVNGSMDLGRQTAPGASHARISRSPFFVLAPCWWTRTQELSIITISPSYAFEIAAKRLSQTPDARHRVNRL